jgi:hypothetical protein
MASVFKPTGKSKYVIFYTDETGRRRKKVGTADKAVSERIARDIENRVALRREGVVDAKAERYRDQGSRPLKEHLDDWHRHMMNKGKTARPADQYRERAGRLAALAKGVSLDELVPGRKSEAIELAVKLLESTLSRSHYGDLTAEAIQEALATPKDNGRSPTTANHHRAALRAFLRWSQKGCRIRENPIEGVEPLAEADPERPRRALTDDELSRLIRSAGSGPIRFNMPGLGSDTASSEDRPEGHGCPIIPEASDDRRAVAGGAPRGDLESWRSAGRTGPPDWIERGAGFPVPEGERGLSLESSDELLDVLGLEVVIRPRRGRST